MTLANELVNVCLVTIVDVERVKMLMVKLACVNHVAEQDKFVEKMRVDFSKSLFVVDRLKVVVGKRFLSVLEVFGGLVVQSIQEGIASFVTLV